MGSLIHDRREASSIRSDDILGTDRLDLSSS